MSHEQTKLFSQNRQYLMKILEMNGLFSKFILSIVEYLMNKPDGC